MIVINSVENMQQYANEQRKNGKIIGFVPTMGYLHEGHLSLVKIIKEKTDISVVSIFVNPTQFGPNEDFDKYPRDLERDKALLNKEGVDVIFHPSPEEMYSSSFQTYVENNSASKILEGEFRPTHFIGVTTIVTMLLNSVKPHIAVFGQKDAQQAYIIRRMVTDLKMDVEIITAPIVRELDGLAKSSRNIYLSETERLDALVLSRSLENAIEVIRNGEFDVTKIINGMVNVINSVQSSQLDYIKIVDFENFKIAEFLEKSKKYYILIACKIGKTRLIDNAIVEA